MVVATVVIPAASPQLLELSIIDAGAEGPERVDRGQDGVERGLLVHNTQDQAPEQRVACRQLQGHVYAERPSTEAQPTRTTRAGCRHRHRRRAGARCRGGLPASPRL